MAMAGGRGFLKVDAKNEAQKADAKQDDRLGLGFELDEKKKQMALHIKQLEWIESHSEDISRIFPKRFQWLKENKELSVSENIKNFLSIFDRAYHEVSYQPALFLTSDGKADPAQSHYKDYIGSVLLMVAREKMGGLDESIYEKLLAKYGHIKPLQDVEFSVPLMKWSLLLEVDPSRLKV